MHINSLFLKSFAVLLILCVVPAFGQGLAITEVYVGLPGPDGTNDWVEITNTGDTPLSFGASDLFYDDASADITEGGNLPAFALEAGASLVILTGVDNGDPDEVADEIAAFEAVWGSGIALVTTDGGGLGQGDDTAFILDSSGQTVDSFSYTESEALMGSFVPAQTFDVATGDFSILGVGGAYESNDFVNDDLGAGPEFLITIIGSPGVIPEPTSAALLALSGILLAKRRHRGV